MPVIITAAELRRMGYKLPPKPRRKKGVAGQQAGSDLEELLATQMRDAGLPEPVRELVFAPPRKFRFDFAFPAVKIALEVEGGTKYRSRHTSSGGYEVDCSKYNLATLLGWKVLRFTGDMVKDGRAVTTIGEALFLLSWD